MWCEPQAWGWKVRLKSDMVKVVTLFCTPSSCVAW